LQLLDLLVNSIEADGVAKQVLQKSQEQVRECWELLALRANPVVKILHRVRADEAQLSRVLQKQRRVEGAFFEVAIAHFYVVGLCFPVVPVNGGATAIRKVASDFVPFEPSVEKRKVSPLPFVRGEFLFWLFILLSLVLCRVRC